MGDEFRLETEPGALQEVEQRLWDEDERGEAGQYNQKHIIHF